MMKVSLCGLMLLISYVDASFLSVNGTSLSFDGKAVFLSGANMPWINYGNDFGNNQTNGHHCQLEQFVHNVSAAGGNSLRVWLFVEGDSIPQFGADGSVVATDPAGTLIPELQRLLRYAASQNVFIVLTLWNGALMRNTKMKNLIHDTQKLTTFIEKVPLIKIKMKSSNPNPYSSPQRSPRLSRLS